MPASPNPELTATTAPDDLFQLAAQNVESTCRGAASASCSTHRMSTASVSDAPSCGGHPCITRAPRKRLHGIETDNNGCSAFGTADTVPLDHFARVPWGVP